MVNSSVRTVSKPASTSTTVYTVAQMLSVFLMVIIGKTSAQYTYVANLVFLWEMATLQSRCDLENTLSNNLSLLLKSS